MATETDALPLGINLDVTDISCQPIGSGLKNSKEYRLLFGVKQPANCVGLKKPKSDYVRYDGNDISWREPFGPGFTLSCGTSDYHVTIILRQRLALRRGEDIGMCSIDCSTLLGTQTVKTPVLSEQGAQLALLKATFTISATDARAALQQAMDANAGMAPVPTTQLPPGLSVVEDTANQLDFRSVLKRLDGFMKVTDLAAEVHPLVKLAWGVVSVAYKVVKLQAKRDSLIQQLVGEMEESCKLAQDATSFRAQSPRSDGIVVNILQQVIQCTYFVKEYCGERSFGGRLLRDTASFVAQQAQDYIDTLQTLCRSLSDHASVSAAAKIYRVFGKVEAIEGLQLLSEIRFAGKAYDDDPNKRCLDGTRTEIIEAILRWATHAESPDPKERVGRLPRLSARVLWLCGVAGSGKSRISRSVAARLQELQRLGSLYCCDYRNRETLNPSSLFSTIARHLADRDPLRKQRLLAAIRDETAARRTEICRQQYQHFIVTPSADLPVVGDTVIVIDAFDEIGNMRDRADALEILTKRAHELPDGLRIVVTSRFERDIQQALQSSEVISVDCMLMEEIPSGLTTRDISVYVRDSLRDVKGLTSAQLAELPKAAGDSFQWASTACRYICDDDDGQGNLPRERLALFMGGNHGLDDLYTRILDEHFGKGSPARLARLKLILGYIISVKEPISLRALWELTPRSSFTANSALSLDDFQYIVRHLASLLVNTHDTDQPIFPFHTSFSDFLRDVEQCHKYLIDVDEANDHLAVGCLEVMERELRFNICQIPTSYRANKDIEDLDALIRKNISPHLRYASHFWAQHFSRLTDVNNMISRKLLSVLSSRFLEWLEVMSVTDASIQAPLVIIGSSSIAQINSSLASLIHDLKQFTSVFAKPIYQGVPHIYLSALAFTPTSSVVHGICQHFPKMVILRQGRMVDWPRLVHVLTGHTEIVKAVAVSPDGSLVVSASDDETIQFWSVATGVPIGKPLGGHTGWVLAVAFSPDGTHIVSGSNDKTVRLWSVKTFMEVGKALKGHAGPVTSVAFSPDGTRVVSGSQDRTIRWWDASTGSPIHTQLVGPGHHNSVTSVVFSPDGEHLISSSRDNTIRVWNAITGDIIGEPLRNHFNWVNCVAFSPDGTRFASGSDDKSIQLWDSQTFTVIGAPLRGHSGSIQSLAFSPDSTLIASGSGDHTIRLWDATTGTAIGQPLGGHTYPVTSLAFLPGGLQVVSGSSDRTMRLWNTVTGAAFGEPSRHNGPVHSVSFSGDGKYIASCSADETIRVWDITLGIAVGNPFQGHSHFVKSVVFSPDSSIIASGSYDRTIRLWKATTGEMLSELKGHDGGVASVVFTPDGAQIVSGSYDRTIRRWSVATGELFGDPMRGHGEWVTSVAVSPDGNLIASASADETIRIYDLKTGALVGVPLEGHSERVNSVTFSPDNTKIASGSNDMTIRLWSIKTQAPIGEPLKGHTSGVACVTFSHHGTFIVSGSYDTTIRVWNVETGIEACEPLRDHTDEVTSVACSPDGIHVASGSWDLSVRLWGTVDILGNGMTSGERNNSTKSDAPSAECTAIGTPSTKGDGAVSHPRPDAAQYPHRLFPDQTFNTRDGWILGPNDELLLWVPPANRADLLSPSSRGRIMGVAHPTELDFRNFKCGTEWTQCREPIDTE